MNSVNSSIWQGGEVSSFCLLISLNFLKCGTHIDPVTDSNVVSAKIATGLSQIRLAVSSCSGTNTKIVT